jgi:hypothetical protein
MIHSAWFAYVVLLIVFGYGIASGVVTNFFNFFVSIYKNKTIITNIMDFLQVVSFALLFFLAINFHNYGVVRLYLFISYCVGFLVYRKTLFKPLAKFLMVVYNFNIKLVAKFKASKGGKILLK